MRAVKEKREFRLNLTSMMDIVFQLIIFFLLVTNFQTQELPELEVPMPTDPATTESREGRIVVNLMPASDGTGATIDHLVVEGRRLASRDAAELSEALDRAVRDRGRAADQVEVDLRAGAVLAYDQVAPVIATITDRRIGRINLVAQSEE